jgi:hypothetical protein
LSRFDGDGNTVIPFEWDEIGAFEEDGYGNHINLFPTWVKRGDLFGLIDIQGREVLPPCAENFVMLKGMLQGMPDYIWQHPAGWKYGEPKKYWGEVMLANAKPRLAYVGPYYAIAHIGGGRALIGQDGSNYPIDGETNSAEADGELICVSGNGQNTGLKYANIGDTTKFLGIFPNLTGIDLSIKEGTDLPISVHNFLYRNDIYTLQQLLRISIKSYSLIAINKERRSYSNAEKFIEQIIYKLSQLSDLHGKLLAAGGHKTQN